MRRVARRHAAPPQECGASDLCLSRHAPAPGARGFGKATTFKRLDEQRDRAVEDLGGVAGRDGVAQERLWRATYWRT
jgi:hypothetical protein